MERQSITEEEKQMWRVKEKLYPTVDQTFFKNLKELMEKRGGRVEPGTSSNKAGIGFIVHNFHSIKDNNQIHAYLHI